MTVGQFKQPTMDEEKLRSLLVAHLHEIVKLSRQCEALTGEVMGEPFDTFREMVATATDRAERFYEFVRTAPL